MLTWKKLDVAIQITEITVILGNIYEIVHIPVPDVVGYEKLKV